MEILLHSEDPISAGNVVMDDTELDEAEPVPATMDSDGDFLEIEPALDSVA